MPDLSKTFIESAIGDIALKTCITYFCDYLIQTNILYAILFQNIQEMNVFGKSELEKTIEHLTYMNHQVIYQRIWGILY